MPNTQSRVGIAGTVYHQNPKQNPNSFSLRCSMPLNTEEEVFSRSPPDPVGKEWQELSIGWLPGCSMLCIKNLEKKVGGNILEVGVVLPVGDHKIVPLHLVVPPGMVTVLYPTTELALRCVNGKVQYTLFAVPE